MQVKDQKSPLEAQPGTPIGMPVEPRRPSWMWALIVVLAAAVLALGGMLVYPAVTTSTGETAMNDLMDAWNSGNVAAFPDVYAPEATMVLSSGETYSGIEEITAAAGESQAFGFQVERTGPVTESDNLIAYPATVTTDTETAPAMIVLRYDDAGMILEHQVIWQTP
jgi:hypothetical protein